MQDFFISYNRADQKWAEWIAWQLEAAGYGVIVQAWDARAGKDFLDWMDQAGKDCERTMGVLSNAYLSDKAKFSRMERHAALYSDKLLPVRIEAIEVEGILGPVAYIDLVDLDEAQARAKLLQEVKLERKKPREAPVFPGEVRHTVPQPKRFPGLAPLIWNLPHLRNPNFTGREDVLAELHQALNSGHPAALTQAITGLGGIGKTQVALEYAYRYAAEYDIIWWVQAETPEILAGDYAALARELGLPEKDLAEQDLVTKAVRRHLEQQDGWLLIFDNAVEPGDVRDYLPRGNARCVLITSRHQEWGELGRAIAVQTWPREEAVDFLLKRTRQSDETAAGDLADALGDLPLALEQAAAYIKTSGISLPKYLALFTERRRDLWKAERPPAAYHQDTVATTWSLAMQEVRETAPVGAEILNLCAFLAPENIPRSFLNQVAGYLPEALGEMFQDELAVNTGIQALGHYSLIISESATLSMHRLVQAVVQDQLSAEDKALWAEAALKCCENIFPGGANQNPSSWSQCLTLLPHAQFLLAYAEQYQMLVEETADLMNKVASYFYGHASYTEAESLYRRALMISEATLGKEHPTLVTRLNELGLILKTQGKYAEAEPLYRRALAIGEAALGRDHQDVATLLNNLANLLYEQGKYAEVEPLYRRALAISETTLGKDHPHIAIWLNNLANLLYDQGKYAEAESFYRRAIEMGEAALGKDHPLVAGRLNNLAFLLHAQGKYDEAEPLYRRALEIVEGQLGADHPDVATCLDNLAVLLNNQGKYAEAEPLCRRALEIIEAQLGADHPSVATSLNNLAVLLNDQGKYDEAEPLYRRALMIRETRLGADHPYVATSLNNLAFLLKAQGKYAEAEPLYRRALEIFEGKLGLDHPNTITGRKNLEGLLKAIKSAK